MNDLQTPPFLRCLQEGQEKGGFETEDVLALLLPLLKQVYQIHAEGKVAPLEGLDSLVLNEAGTFALDPLRAHFPRKNLGLVNPLQTEESRGVEVVGESRSETDLDEASIRNINLRVQEATEPLTRPVFVPGYRSWEHVAQHQDELTDIFSLGLLLASLGCGLDFSAREDVELFAGNRHNLFALNRRLNPVLASTILQMTELNRHKRAPDLFQIITRLENYREQDLDVDFNHLQGFKDSNLAGKRRMIQAHLRDRLFDISRRNRLIYFKQTLQTLNLTVASVPLLLDYRNIKLENLFVWHPTLAASIIEGSPLSLGKYLRFEDAPYIPGVLDKIISEARRDRNEYGFSELRLVLCFLRWHNLREFPEEKIHSPLLLLPVELTRKKGLRDNYVLDPTSQEAEVNPALRHYLKELYNLVLPEVVNLKETSLHDFYENLRAQIQANEPGITLHKIERPQIQLIHEKARQRLDQYRRRMKMQSRRRQESKPQDYSYDRENFKPLGLQLFLEKIKPHPMPLRDVMGAAPTPHAQHLLEEKETILPGNVLEKERQMYALKDADNQNPYSWDFDLCSLTLGNFNYRKMTLVRDYFKLIETDMGSRAFDRVFSLEPRQVEESAVPPLPLEDQHLVIACDATQASAIARARLGQSYIIQGPPGTGKSQTITNLVADYIAQGKRVLFVCEKRAAIDVVFHRLRQQGLDELCCLIHDSQTDKKAFIQDLKQTYEKFLNQGGLDQEAVRTRDSLLRRMRGDLDSLERFSEAMSQTPAPLGIPLRALLHRLIELGSRLPTLDPTMEERLPEYWMWRQNGDVIQRLQNALSELGEALDFHQHPFRWLGASVLLADRPLEAFTQNLDRAEDLLEEVESALELSGLPPEFWDSFEEIDTILDFAERIRPLMEKQLFAVIQPGALQEEFDALARKLDLQKQALEAVRLKTIHWKDPFSAEDTENALRLAQGMEQSIFRFFQPAFWKLKKSLQARYDFSQHAVTPPWTKILQELSAFHQATSQWESLLRLAQEQWKSTNVTETRATLDALRVDPVLKHSSIKKLIPELLAEPNPLERVDALVAIHRSWKQLKEALNILLASYDAFTLPHLLELLQKLRQQTGLLAELAPILSELMELPAPLTRAVREVEVPLNEFEYAIGRKSLNQVYRQDRHVARLEGRGIARKMNLLQQHYGEWLGWNARSIRARVQEKFLERVNVSSLPASQLTPEQKLFKKSYAAGRRDLEHEFGKSMRYKSIRELAAGETGQVIQDLKPVWLMSPLSVSDTLPLDPDLFDVVIFDEASQIPLEEAIPAVYRAHQVIIVGDEMQLPPTTFFAAAREEEDAVMVEEDGQTVALDLDSDSFLTQSARNLPATLLAWHYRSRYESLISFSNAAFYTGNLFTIPDRQRSLEAQPEILIKDPAEGAGNVDALLSRSISFHRMENSPYLDRTNPGEASYIACLVRSLLQKQTKLSIGLVAFSEAQQTELEGALARLAEEDPVFAEQLESEYNREENDVYCGLFVKNLENVQGDERDIIILSICYGPDPSGKMLMNFGPINQRGGEKRLNVIFSRARHHMAVVSSIRHHQITNDYNDGANSLKNFLQYAEAISRGETELARRVLENLNPLSRKALTPLSKEDAVVQGLAAALQKKGYWVDTHVGQSRFRCHLAVRRQGETLHQVGVLVDNDSHYLNPSVLDRFLLQPSILKAFGWRFCFVLTKDWFHDPDDVVHRVIKTLEQTEEEPALEQAETEPAEELKEVTTTEAPPAANANLSTEPPVAQIPLPANPGPSRYFELVNETSSKFWEITITDQGFTVRFGRLGSAGQSQTKQFADPGRARQAAEALIHEKTKKGYREVKGVPDGM